MQSPSIQKLIDIFAKFPTIGPRTAARFVFYLMKLPLEEINELNATIDNIHKNISICSFCFNPFEAEGHNDEKLCKICSDQTRNRTILCVVEKETDLESIEKIKKYRGLYFVLGGTVSALKKQKLDKLRIDELIERLKKPETFGVSGGPFTEIIIATNSTMEGEATLLYLKRLLNPLGIRMTRLARGLPVGGELEYADEETLESALEGRK